MRSLRDENDAVKSEEGKGLFLDSRVKKSGGRSRAKGEKRGLSDY